MSSTRFLKMAERFGASLVEQAIWTDDACTWTVNVPYREQPAARISNPEDAGGHIYQGTAGIGFFLAQLVQHTDTTDAEALSETADGALRHAVRTLRDINPERLKQNFGFHNGPIGVAWALMQSAPVCNADVEADIRALIEPLDAHEHLDQGIDVIAGAAGAIPALLQLASFLGSDGPARMALRLGETLIRRANKEPIGWSWPTVTSAAARYLTGYAHGAAGVGQAFLELYAVTGAPRYRYAAQRAFRYEDQFFNPENGNWPDFRNTDRSLLLRTRSPDELANMTLRGELPTYSYHTMSAWCHGAPGIALARLRSMSLLPDDTDRDAIEHALDTTADTLSRQTNYSLCHGFSGNALSLVYASEVLGDDPYRTVAMEQAHAALDAWEHTTAWPGGTIAQEPDPSLMLGTAGTGHFLLKLHDPTVSHVCILTAPDALEIGPLMEEEEIAPGMESLVDGHIRRFFPTALMLADQAPPVLGEYATTLAPPTTAGLRDTPVLDYRDAILALLREDGNASPPARDLVESAVSVDLERVRVVQSIDDFTTHHDDAYLRYAIAPVDWATATVRPSSGMVLVEQPHDWETWLAGDPDERGDQPPDAPTTYVLFDQAPALGAKQLGVFGALVLKQIDGPTTRSAIVDALRDFIDASVPDRVIEQKVTEQLQRAYDQGVIVPTEDMIDRFASPPSADPQTQADPSADAVSHVHPPAES